MHVGSEIRPSASRPLYRPLSSALGRAARMSGTSAAESGVTMFLRDAMASRCTVGLGLARWDAA